MDTILEIIRKDVVLGLLLLSLVALYIMFIKYEKAKTEVTEAYQKMLPAIEKFNDMVAWIKENFGR